MDVRQKWGIKNFPACVELLYFEREVSAPKERKERKKMHDFIFAIQLHFDSRAEVFLSIYICITVLAEVSR